MYQCYYYWTIISFQWRGFYFNNGTSSLSGLIEYPISFNIVYFINITNHSSKTTSDTQGVESSTCIFSNSPKVTNINSGVWVSNPVIERYLDIIAIGI